MFFVEKNRDKWRVFLEKLFNFTKNRFIILEKI